MYCCPMSYTYTSKLVSHLKELNLTPKNLVGLWSCCSLLSTYFLGAFRMLFYGFILTRIVPKSLARFVIHGRFICSKSTCGTIPFIHDVFQYARWNACHKNLTLQNTFFASIDRKRKQYTSNYIESEKIQWRRNYVS